MENKNEIIRNHTLPEGVINLKTPGYILAILLISFILTFISRFIALIAPIALLTCIVCLSAMIFDKRYKTFYFTQRAIKMYKQCNYGKSYKYCIKALKYNTVNQSAMNLKEYLEASQK